MAQPSPPAPLDLRHLVAEARELRERVHRVAVALSITEDMTAEAYRKLADADADDATATGYRGRARRSSATADACRTFARTLDELTQDE